VVERFDYSPFGELLTQPTHDTPFLFNGQYGVMTDANDLYYMRARFYSPDLRRFINQDILLGNIADGQSLNRYAYVRGRVVSRVDPFGLEDISGEYSQGFNAGKDDVSHSEAISLVIDFLPVAGSCKGLFEVAIGADPITGKPISRWGAALGIIPFDKSFTKGQQAGEAIVYLYKGEENHFSIVVKTNDKVLHTEQVVRGFDNTTISRYNDFGDKVRKQLQFNLPNAQDAQIFQEGLLNKNTGKYDIDSNSCLSHVCDVLREGGLDVPIFSGDERWKLEAYQWLLKNQKK